MMQISKIFTCASAVEVIGTQSINRVDKAMMVIAHGITWKMTGIAKGCISFLGDLLVSKKKLSKIS